MAFYNESACNTVQVSKQLLVSYRSCQSAGQSKASDKQQTLDWVVAVCCLTLRRKKIAMVMARRDPYHTP